tara:strand:+ start:5611 stop:6582 length:972 start_codon:yes stop_codon:yes gene_type:complete
MSKPIAIIAGEPNSISSEIIFKSWKLRKKFKYKPIIIIGSIKLLNLQKRKLKQNIKIHEINKKFKKNDLKNNYLNVLNVQYKQKKPFEKISKKTNKYIFDCFKVAINLANSRKILGIINCPISKETLLKNTHKGITEFLAKKTSSLGKEVMLIYNKKLSVIPITTHIPLRSVRGELNKSKIIKKIKIVYKFYKQNFNIKPRFGVLGLNPHNFSNGISEEKTIISPAIKSVNKYKIKAFGPISPDTSFMRFKKMKINVAVGMYHDQVLLPFKTLFKYDAINITLGLPFIRISPDHGTAEDIAGKNIANPNSLVKSIQFFNSLKK